jgi:hypothetical protein
MNQKTLIIVFAVLFLCCCLLVVGGGVTFYLLGNSSSNESKLVPLMLNPEDLPDGWESAKYMYTIPYREGTLETRSSVFDYYYPGDISASIALSHLIYLYPSEETGAAGYQKLHDEWINGILEEVDINFTFAPRNPADKFDIYCTETNAVGTYSCDFVQQHGSYVILLRSWYDDKALTASQVDDILRRLDAKLP